MTFREYLNEACAKDSKHKKNRKLKEEMKDGDKEAYQKFFDKILKKYGVDSPEDLSAEQKKKFFDEVDKGWKADKESD